MSVPAQRKARNAAPDTDEVPPATGLLQEKSFRAYWLARLAAQTAQGALLYGLLVLIVDRTDKSIWASIFVICSIIPALLFGLLGGWVADRLPQRSMMIWLSVARAGVVALLLVYEPTLAMIFLVTLGIWTVHQFFSPAESAVMARLVDIDAFSRASALGNLALTLAQVLGMVILAPILLRLPSERFLFAACALLYASAVLFYLRMGRLTPRPAGERRQHPLSLRGGWEAVVADRPSYTALIDSVLNGIGMSTLVVIVPHYLVRVLDTSASNTVFVFAPAVIGLVFGLQVAPRMGLRYGHGKIATAGLIGFALAVAGFGTIDAAIRALEGFRVPLSTIENHIGISERVSATMILSVPAGFFSALTSVGSRTVLLERTPADLRGQVFATQSTLSNAGALVPTLIAGVAIDLFGVEPVAFSVAVILVIAAVLARRVGNEQSRPATQNLWSTAALSGMSHDDIGILRFAETAGGLKQVRRQGWIDRGVRDPESSADHSWAVGLLGWALAGNRPDLDRQRVMLLGLVHDLPEAIAGDATPFDEARDERGRVPEERFQELPVYSENARQSKRERELAALEEMVADLPAGLAAEIRDAWHEYDASETPEAKFVHQVDKLETLLQAETYRAQQRALVTDSFLRGARRDVTDEDLARLIEGIASANHQTPSAAEQPKR